MMRYRCAVAVLLTACAASVHAQDAHLPAATDTAGRIRAIGLHDSRAMALVTDLSDTVGARLTGSPGYDRGVRWAIDALRDGGLSGVHDEDAGPFGMAWEQTRASLRLVSPGMTILAASAAPWSHASAGEVRGRAAMVEIRTIDDLARFHGRLRGRIVFLGRLRPLPLPTSPVALRYASATPEALGRDVAAYYAARPQRLRQIAERTRLKRVLGRFFRDEGVSAIVLPGRDDGSGGGSGLIPADDGAMPVEMPWRVENQLALPILYTDTESFNQVSRLASGGHDPEVALTVEARVTARERPVVNVVGELPGSDPALRSQIVLLGAHLDSWAGGTGATDNGAGVAICIEAMRIMREAGILPKRTIRIVLYGGEEQGLIGSRRYAERHFGVQPRRDDDEQRAIPVVGWRAAEGAPRLLPEHARLSVAFNIDGGSGRIRGIFSGGNPALAARLRQWIAPLRDLGVESVVDGPSWPADQTSFSDLGLPTIDFAQDPLDYDSRAHHTQMDRLERVSAPDMAQAATVVATLVAAAADAPEMIPRR